MLVFLNRYSRDRLLWLLVTISALGMEMISLWSQYEIGLKPCVLCIYERCALLGIMGAGLIGSIAPKTLLRYVAIVILLYSSWKGVVISWEHTNIQLYPSLFMTCDFKTRFPSWLPLDKLLPQLFVAYSDCSADQWKFLSFEMSQWLVGAFIAYFVVTLLVLIAQLFNCSL